MRKTPFVIYIYEHGERVATINIYANEIIMREISEALEKAGFLQVTKPGVLKDMSKKQFWVRKPLKPPTEGIEP